jgi:methyl-accepting chemotaxis protein
MSMKQKLMLTMVLLASIPMLVSVTAGTWFAKEIAGELLIEQAEKKLVSIREFKKRTIEGFLINVRKQIGTLVLTDTILDAANNFTDSYQDVVKRLDDLEKRREELKAFYTEQFGEKYQQLNAGSDLDMQALVSGLSDNAVAMQSLYISDNPNPLGEKQKLEAADDRSTYSIWHKSYHEQIKHFLDTYGYDDVFIVHPKTGDIMYSVFKELDYATSLIDGPYANTGIGEAFRAASATTDRSFTYLTDFGSYTPSYDSSALFISAPVFSRFKMVAVLIFQLSSEQLNKMMTGDNGWERDGLGESGEVYLVGKDKLMRSNRRFLIESPDEYAQTMRDLDVSGKTIDKMLAHQTSVLLQKVETKGVEKALNGETGFDIFPDYRNVRVLSAYTTLDIPGLEWALMSEMGEDEAFAPASYLSQTLLISSAIVASVMFGVALLLGWWITGRLTNPIQQLEQDISEIEANSDLSRRLHSKTGDVTSGITESLNNMLEKLHSIVNMVADSSVSMAGASSNMQDISKLTSGDVLQQKQETDQVSASMKKMIDTVTDVAFNADEANNAAKEANSQASQGNSVVLAATQSIGALASDVLRASDVITNLANEADNIGGVLDVIRGIAEQTNLLALNAAIEAARAGEQGRGFAVVADEVRSLASRTQDSTAEIQLMIESLQTGTQNAVSVMEQGQKQAEVSVNQANEASVALQKITDTIDSITQMNERIAAASNQQRLVTDDVTRSINSISSISDSTTANAQKTEQASVKLSGLASDLQSAVTQFKL